MGDQKNTDEIKPLRLSDLFSPEQEAQLVQLLVNLIAQKWGTLEIEIVKGRIRFFRSKVSVEAVPPGVLSDW